MKARDPSGGELDSAGDCVDQPPEDNFHRLKCAVPLPELLEADGVLLPLIVVGIRRAEGQVDTVKEDPPEAPPPPLAPLRQ